MSFDVAHSLPVEIGDKNWSKVSLRLPRIVSAMVPLPTPAYKELSMALLIQADIKKPVDEVLVGPLRGPRLVFTIPITVVALNGFQLQRELTRCQRKSRNLGL